MQDLISNVPAVIYEYAFFPNGNLGFNYVSDRSVEILGLSPVELTTDPSLLDSIIFHEDKALLRKAFGKDPAAGVTRNVQVRIQVRNELKQITIRYVDEISDKGVILRRGVIQEIRPADLVVAAEPGPYEELLEKLPIGVVIHHDSTIVFANTHANFLIGAHNHNHLIGLNAFDFVHPDCHAGIADRIRQVSAGKSVPMVEEKFIRMDGTSIDVETMAFPFLYKGKTAIQVIFRDITEKKRTEAQVRRNETLFTQLFQNAPMAVVMLDETGKVSEINRGFEQMFGFEKDVLRGKNLNDFIVPENLQSEGIDLNNLIASNQVVSIESARKHRSGKLINVILYGVPVMQDKHVIGIYGVYVDITDRKRVEEELKIRNAELDNFVYKVSHDLRAPLSSVLGLVNLSRLEGNNDSPLEYMDLIGEKILALDHFIGDVLSHSKNLKMEVTIGQVDLKKIIEQTFTDLGYLDGARETRRSVRIEGVDFYSDQWRISEIFRNLISNAIKYRRPDADDSEVVIKIQVDHICAEITFGDNGMGIKEASLKRIFEMFYRATDRGEGSGIGLYIVKNAVEKLGGQIKVASSPGQGTRFNILLPNHINSIIGTSTTSPE